MKSLVAGVGIGACMLISGVCLGQCGDENWSQGPSLATSRTGSAMAYDSVRGKLVMFGGVVNGGALSNTTLEFDGTQWQTVQTTNPPSARTGHAMVFDEARGVVVLFGGGINGGYSNATWEYDGQWRVATPAVSPPPLKWHAMAYDAVRQVVVLHGGILGNGTISATMFEHDGTTWSSRGTGGPGARYQHSMAFEPTSETVLIFGGRTALAGVYSSESWLWNGTAWLRTIGSSPSPRAGSAIATCDDCVLLFGGGNGSVHYDSTWQFKSGLWSQTSLATTPFGRTDGCLTYNPNTRNAVLSGGTNGSVLFSDVWVLRMTSELELSPPLSQAAPAGAAISFFTDATDPSTTWQWFHNGTLVSNSPRVTGADTQTLTITGLLGSDAGSYEAEATNACGTARSDPATLTVLPACGNSDFNGDGDFGTDADIEAFFACLAGNCCSSCFAAGADFNVDGDTGTDADIEAFFRVLAGGHC